jgi:hypothetical protein
MTDNNLIGHEVKAAPCAPRAQNFLTWSATPIRGTHVRARTRPLKVTRSGGRFAWRTTGTARALSPAIRHLPG